MGLWGIILVLPRWVPGDVALWLLQRVTAVQRLAAGILIVLGVALTVAVGV